MTDIHTLPPGDPATRLDADRRRLDLAAARSGQPLDVLVIGGGITGAGVALDAATRGLSVLLIDKDDLAFGTSRWSSKLIHGGVRYLAKGDVAVAWESAVERAIIAGAVAPHLVRALPQLVPVWAGHRSAAVLARLGLGAADLMRVAARTPRGSLPHGRMISAKHARRLAPGLRADGLVGGVLGHDFQLIDDARLVVAVARTAAGYGAHVLTGVRATSVDADGTAVLQDVVSQDRWTLRARHIVNATGVWADRLDPDIRLQPSLGTHIIVPSALLGDSPVSLTVAVPGHFGRFVFTLPQQDGCTFVGLTDVPFEGDLPEVPQAPSGDVAWILSILNTALASPLQTSDVVGTFAGLRPLLVDGRHDGAASADLSRRHCVTSTGSVLTVTGGKLTTYRRMAADVVGRLTDRPCRTDRIALVGATQHRAPGVPPALVRRYGGEAALVWSLGDSDPGLRQPVAPGSDVFGVDLAFGAQWEGARTEADLLERRTRLALVPSRAEAARPQAQRVLARSAAAASV